MLSATIKSGGPKRATVVYRRPFNTPSVQTEARTCHECSYCAEPLPAAPRTVATRTLSLPLPSSQARLPSEAERSTKPLFDCISTALSTLNSPETLRPLIFPNVKPDIWRCFTRLYANHPALANGTKWEYDANRCTITVVALATPFHDIACSIMAIQHSRLFVAGVDTARRFERLKVNRSRMSKQTDDGRSDREPDCAVLAIDYHRAIPTIVWEVGHSQGFPALVKRAKMWCRRYDGNVRVVILVKYMRRNPRVDKAAKLWVYRPARRGLDGRWTAEQQGPVYTLFPVPLNAGSPEDAIPLTYADYFGPGNVGVGVDPLQRCDLALDLVRQEIDEGIQTTLVQDQYRHVSGGSSVPGVLQDNGVEEIVDEVEGEREREEREQSPDGEAYQEYGVDWDATMSDVSDD